MIIDQVFCHFGFLWRPTVSILSRYRYYYMNVLVYFATSRKFLIHIYIICIYNFTILLSSICICVGTPILTGRESIKDMFIVYYILLKLKNVHVTCFAALRLSVTSNITAVAPRWIARLAWK